ncbi:MAG: PLP-dependent aminotransferase family protein [Mucilaginibacter sp.]
MPKITPQILLTFISVSKQPGKTLNAQLYEQLKNSIYQGMLRAGDRLPSSREMGAELGISRNSVLQVFEQLTMEGFFETQTGAGTFVSAGAELFFSRKKQPQPGTEKPPHAATRQYGMNDAFKEHASELEPIMPFQTSVPMLPEFPFAAWARVSAAVHQRMDKLHLGYDDAQGYLPLRQALASHLRISRSINCGPDNIVIVNSSRQALHLAAELLLNKGDECWMEDPGYPGARSAMQRFGAKTCPIPIAADGIDIDYAIQHHPNGRLVYVTPSHQFPMGSTLSLSQRIKLLNHAAEQNMWIIEDDYDSEFRYNGRPIPALQGIDTNGNVIYLGTLSKVLLPALRLGYMVLPTVALARRFAVAKSAIEGQGNIITHATAAEFITQGHFSRHIRRMRLLYKKAQDDLVSLINLHLPGILTPVPVEAGMHLLAWLPEGVDASEVAAEALKHGLVINTLSQYSIKFAHKNGVILGFAGFKFNEMERAVLVLKKVLERCC